nr:MAG TPA: hypothetical protein [Caudoviricetes sp.]
MYREIAPYFYDAIFPSIDYSPTVIIFGLLQLVRLHFQDKDCFL